MLLNLSTLDFDDSVDEPARVMAWSPAYGAWVVLAREKSAAPPPGVIEITPGEISQIRMLRQRGVSKEDALAAVGVRVVACST